MKVLLVTPPMTQLNTPYPSLPHLTGYLRGLGYEVQQADLSLELALELFSHEGVKSLYERAGKYCQENSKDELPDSIMWFIENGDHYMKTIDPVVRFLQGNWHHLH